MIKHIPTIIAVYKGCAIENVAKNTAMIPRINISTDFTLDILSGPKIMPVIPTNININAIK